MFSDTFRPQHHLWLWRIWFWTVINYIWNLFCNIMRIRRNDKIVIIITDKMRQTVKTTADQDRENAWWKTLSSNSSVETHMSALQIIKYNRPTRKLNSLLLIKKTNNSISIKHSIIKGNATLKNQVFTGVKYVII